MHRTKPQTAAVGLTDSPAGLAAWIVEKLRAWSDCDGDVERRFTKDEILTNVTLYWLTGTIGSSMRMYRANAAIPPAQHARRVEVPSGFSLFPGDIVRPPRAWLERTANVVRVTEPARGGHFAPFEEPELYAQELRAFFRPYRVSAGRPPAGRPRWAAARAAAGRRRGRAADLADDGRHLVAARGVRHPVVPQGVVHGEHAARPQQPHGLLDVAAGSSPCRRRRTPGRSRRRSAAAARRARGPEMVRVRGRAHALLGERLLGGALVLHLEVDRREHAVRRACRAAGRASRRRHPCRPPRPHARATAAASTLAPRRTPGRTGVQPSCARARGRAAAPRPRAGTPRSRPSSGPCRWRWRPPGARRRGRCDGRRPASSRRSRSGVAGAWRGVR